MPSKIETALPDLFTLAHDRSEAGRIALAEKLADLFLGPPMRLTEAQEAQVNALIEELLTNNNYIVRRELAKRLAAASRLPRKMAMTLAKEPIELAGPVLTHCEQFTDEDLITVVETQSRNHALAVAARQSINEAVADALIVTGDIEIMKTVAANLGAKLSPNGIAALTEAARTTLVLQQPMVVRPELTTDLALHLYWWLEADLRRATLERFILGTGQLDLALAKTIEDRLNASIFERFNGEKMADLADWFEERGALTPRILPQILRLNHFSLFNIVLGRMVDLDKELIKTIIRLHGGRPLAAVCRALNVEKAAFVSIFLLSRGARPDEHIVHPHELTEALQAFDRLTPALGRDLVATWRIDPTYLTHPQETPATSAKA
jgi:uncharacterized protein (DUF2336 family)